MNQNRVAVLVHSCDRYALLYKGFHHFFTKNWNFSINCNYYFATELLDVNFPEFKNEKSGKGEWSDRLSLLLKEKIKEDYIIYFQEDMWLTSKINPAFFNQLIDSTIKNNWKQVKLSSSEVYKTIPTNTFIEGFNIAKLDNEKSRYLMSHQITLWNKQFLIEQLGKNESPWRNERKGTKRLRKVNPTIYHTDYFSDSGKEEVNNNTNPVGRCLYFTISENAMLHQKTQPFIEALLVEKDDLKEYGLLLKRHFDNGLTHDGKLKPRKDDILKRLKNWLTGTE